MACGGGAAPAPATQAPIEPPAVVSVSPSSEPTAVTIASASAGPAPSASVATCGPTSLPDGQAGCLACPPATDLHAMRATPAPPTLYDGTPLRDPRSLAVAAGDPGEASYRRGLAHEAAKSFTDARKDYYDVIKSTPQSSFVIPSYLAFGDLFYDEAVGGDPTKYPLASQAYQKAVTVPPPGNRLYVYAWYKLANVFWQTGDFAQSLSAFRKAIQGATSFPQLTGSPDIATGARRASLQVYAQTGDPTAAYAYFHDISGDTPGTNGETFAMMEVLGNYYIVTGHYTEAAVLFRDLLARTESGEPGQRCGYQTLARAAACAASTNRSFRRTNCPELSSGP
jgi:hypothetical protein